MQKNESFYNYPYGERVTPVEEIPREFRFEANLPNGGTQIIDRRLCYTFHPEYRDKDFPNGALLECVNLALDESNEMFFTAMEIR